MKHLAAYMLLVLAGTAEPSEDQVSKLLKDSGVAADKDNLKLLCEKLKGKKIHEMVAEGMGKFASMPSGGAGGAPAAAEAPAAGKTEAKKEEPKKEEEEEADLDMGDLFGY